MTTISWPLVTLAVPETSTGELIAVAASGLSMMTFRLPGMGVAAVAGSEERGGWALALALALVEAWADAPAVGDPLSSTKVVVLSPPHPASAANAIPNSRTTPNPFINPLQRLGVATVTYTARAVWSGRAHYSSRS